MEDTNTSRPAFMRTLARRCATALTLMLVSASAISGPRGPNHWSIKDIHRDKHPHHVRVEQSPSGRTDIYWGSSRDAAGRVSGPHGHIVKNPADDIEYARTPKGTVIYDTGNHVPRK